MPRFALTLLILAATSATTMAQDKAKPNTLTPKEIADGWILLFDGETTFGWKIDGDASISDGNFKLGGKKETTSRLTTWFGSFELHYDYLLEGKDEAKKAWFYLCIPTGKQTRSLPANEGWSFGIERVEYSPEKKTMGWTSQYSSYTDEKKSVGRASENGNRKYNQNTIEFQVSEGAKLTLRNIKFRPTTQTPIFNGKDLTGWKEIPGKKSKFSVNDKGELNVKDGNGDLQTTGQWDDFVLQLDCISNGTHLNSGVFFRCLPGQFWSGYEAQIRNQWVGDDRTKPVDYGTGGIYNRQPARKVVSTDKEWFTMTVVAHGNHLATWVNGYQVTDFTDMRPPNMSARKGLKLDKGPISLQGHDPTTDLSFRNIRIEAMPRPVAKP